VVAIRPAVLAVVHGDTATTMCQPLEEVGEICRRHDVLFDCDTTAILGGNLFEADDWGLDVATAGMQRCLGGFSGSAPITISERPAGVINDRKHVEADTRESGDPAVGRRISSSYFDLPWSWTTGAPAAEPLPRGHTMLYGARECARLLVE
jgi:(S)-ureidoglycine-glyoxylate aminotransferase